MKRLGWHVLAVSVLAVGQFGCQPAPIERKIDKGESPTALNTKIDDGSHCVPTRVLSASSADLKVTVQADMVDGRQCPPLLSGEFWGSEGKKPLYYITQLRISYLGKRVMVPISAFSDLSNIESLSIGNEEGVYIVSGTSSLGEDYTLKIFLENGNISRRLVSYDSFKDDVFEETNYSSVD